MERDNTVLKAKAHGLMHTLFTAVYSTDLTGKTDLAECDQLIVDNLVF